MAASSRFGFTSVACIDCEMSITSTTVARSLGIMSTPLGRAHAAVSVTSEASDSATARCRRHCDCLRHHLRHRTVVLVKRIPVRFLRRTAQT